MEKKNLKKNYISLIIFSISTLLFLQTCENNQNKIFNKLQNEFNSSIKNSNAKSFDYQYDGLSPQNSYFIDCKLKYLTLQSNGEISTTTDFITFENDSISKIIRRIQIYEGNDNGNGAGRNWNKIEKDSVFVLDIRKKTKDIYEKNKLSKTIRLKSFDQDMKYYIEVKKQTEKEYNCRLKKTSNI